MSISEADPNNRFLGGYLQRSSLSPDSVSSHSGTWHGLDPNDPTETKKRKIDMITPSRVPAEKKLEDRAEKSRTASRLYRQRKKKYQSELKVKFDEVISQKQELVTELQQQRSLLEKLTEENAVLKEERITDSNILEVERKELVHKLDMVVAKGDEEGVSQILAQLRVVTKKIKNIGVHHLEELISPTTVSALVRSGFFKTHAHQALNQGGTVADVAKKIFEVIPDLTNEQKKNINEVVTAHQDSLVGWEKERLLVNDAIEKHFQSRQIGKSKPPGLKRLMEMTGSLEKLRTNLEMESKAWEDAIGRILMQLTVMQRGIFQLNVETRHASLQQLKYLWSAIYGQ
eukprot:TRINITY_DN2489_c0_g1_i1.p1 TRINITY_DN2489_c0_g1~~TRINITY_DN2489_c0_g1_i1.p1  ORF type:complete len:344 (-),score=100.18 TRINITY_DN2489_c0_g1_i1:143-1174(-)